MIIKLYNGYTKIFLEDLEKKEKSRRNMNKKWL